MLVGKRILIVEDEWLLADHLAAIVEDAGAVVIGPTATVADALTLLEGAPAPDAATLNVRLAEHVSYPVADRLAALNIPYMFISANMMQSMPERFHQRPLIAKPFTNLQISVALVHLFEVAA